MDLAWTPLAGVPHINTSVALQAASLSLIKGEWARLRWPTYLDDHL